MPHNFPRVIHMVRGGKRRRCFMVQPYLPACHDVMRVALMEIASVA